MAPFMLTVEEAALAELLAELGAADWARIVFRLSEEARDEIRAAVGTLQAEASLGSEE